ncbi:hypothetical protein TNCV_2918821 [Trichonephila clavipes]|nr:hypothetical protein TNCV_2918821 [Trichonephila clavipes]
MPNHDTGCKTSVVMHNGTVQQPLTMVSPNSNPTIMILQTEVGFVNKNNVVPFHGLCPCSSHHWRHKRMWFPVKGKQSNKHFADILLCCKQRLIV